MKLKKAMMSLAAATAAGLCISAYAGQGQNGKLTLGQFEPQFEITAANAENPSGGSWNSTPGVVGQYIAIDCDEGQTNQFTATSVTTGAVVNCDFELQVAPVPANLRPASAPGAQTAFCVCVEGTTTNFCAFVNGVWKDLTGVDVPAAETDYSLRVTFDYKSGKFVKFSVKTTGDYVDLYGGTPSTNWFETGVAAGVTGVREYCFVGTGNVESFQAAQANVVAEAAPVVIDGTPVEINIPEEAVAAFGGGGGAAAAATALAEKGDNNATMLDNYILFGATSKAAVTSNTKPVAKPAIVADGDHNIPLGFENLVLKPVVGATVKYQLKGAETSAGPFSNVGNAETDAANLKIPANTSYRVFKVDVTVEYGNN